MERYESIEESLARSAFVVAIRELLPVCPSSSVIHVAEGTFPARVQKAVLAAHLFHERLVALLASIFDK